MDDEDFEAEEEVDEEDYVEPGQCLNLSWNKGADPVRVSFPF